MVQYRKTNYVVEAENVISYDTEMTLYAVSRTNMRRKYSNKGWKNALGSMGWNWQRKRRGEGKPNTFDFLGFTFYCGMDGRKQFYRCRVKTSRKKFRRKIKAMKEWIKRNRTKLLEWLFKMVNAKLRGHYQYYGVTDNTKEEKNFLNRTRSLLFKWLNRRSQKRSYTWETFNNGLLRTFPLLEPRVKVSLFYR